MHLPRCLHDWTSLVLMLPTALGQSVVYTTASITVTEVAMCTTTQFTTKILDICPCSSVFPTVSTCKNCLTCTTTTIGPRPSVEAFKITLTVPLDSGDESVTLSRVGNTVGIGGPILYFNITSDGALMDVDTGEIVYVILPSGSHRKRFDDSIDLLIGTPPSSATYRTWGETNNGELALTAKSSSGRIYTLGFGVALANDGTIDKTVPIQMYDTGSTIPTNLEPASPSESDVIISTSSKGPITTSSISSDITSDESSTSSASTSSTSSTTSSSTKNGKTYTITQYGSTTGISSTTLSNRDVYVITTKIQATVTITFYASLTSISTASFNNYFPTVTVYDVLSQAITTETHYGPNGYTSTPVIGSIYPTLTAIAQLSQVTVTNTTYGPSFSTIFAQTDDALPTVTYWIQFVPSTTSTTTEYIYNLNPVYNTTLYYTTPTASVFVFTTQYRIFTTNTGPSDITTTIGPSNPTATVSVMISPTTTVTLPSISVVWTLSTTSSSIVPQTPGYTLTIQLYIPWPSSSYVRFQPSDATGSAQFFTVSSTTLRAQPTETVYYLFTGSNSKCQFIQVNNNLVLATDPLTGNRLPEPQYPFGYLPPEPMGSNLFFANLSQFDTIDSIVVVGFNYVSAGSNFLQLNSAFSSSELTGSVTTRGATRAISGNFWYEGSTTGPYTPMFYRTTDAAIQPPVGKWTTIGTTEMSMTNSAPTAR
ncbi:hypothetical protein AA313_de0200344 [Arthrobotrys entomopaga]|nr:hypothetical protein AA313_de0200344 [Arthrobotrys entomopaga]